jgi:hypothetical protein
VVGVGAGAFLAPLPHEQSWPRAAAATQSAHHGTQGLRRSLEPNLAVEAGSCFLGLSRAQPVRYECSPFVIKHVTISLEIKLSNMSYLSNGKGDNSTITEKNNGKLCPDRTVNTIF